MDSDNDYRRIPTVRAGTNVSSSAQAIKESRNPEGEKEKVSSVKKNYKIDGRFHTPKSKFLEFNVHERFETPREKPNTVEDDNQSDNDESFH